MDGTDSKSRRPVGPRQLISTASTATRVYVAIAVGLSLLALAAVSYAPWLCDSAGSALTLLSTCIHSSHHTPDLERVLATAPLTDGHNDLAIWLRAFYGNRINNLTDQADLLGQVDLPRLRSSRLRFQFWSGYVPCPEDDSDKFPEPLYYENIHDTLQQIDLINRLNHDFPDQLRLASSSSDIRGIFQSSDHVIAGVIGLEGLHQIGNSASVMRIYHQLGVRYITLTHDCNNLYADAALAPEPRHGGLSDAGRELIKEMNRIGMVVDLSHVSAATMRDALNVTGAPVMFSHSNAYGLCQHPRNVPDDVLRTVQTNGGVVMVSFYPQYLNSTHPASANLQDVADHIMYIGNMIGFEHVGIGADFDGMDKAAHGLDDVSKYTDLLQELIRRGIKTHELEGVVGNNALRVLEGVETVSKSMVTARPLEDTVRPFFGNESRASSRDT